MYWYNRICRRLIFFIASLILFPGVQSCKNKDTTAGNDRKYFDLKGYFNADSMRLTKLNPLVSKTVVHDKVSETKKVHIPNWGTELGLFSGSDINKSAWRSSYKIQSSNDFLIYKAIDPALKTRDIIIKKNGDKIKWILIFNHTKNMLYETEEKLSYYPDSLYIIQKLQRVRLLGTDNYKISGLFSQR